MVHSRQSLLPPSARFDKSQHPSGNPNGGTKGLHEKDGVINSIGKDFEMVDPAVCLMVGGLDSSCSGSLEEGTLVALDDGLKSGEIILSIEKDCLGLEGDLEAGGLGGVHGEVAGGVQHCIAGLK